MTQPQLSTLLLRAATSGDLASAQALLPDATVVPGAQLYVLADPADAEDRTVRAAAVVRPGAGSWTIELARADTRWPPVAAAFVEQLRAVAVSAGAGELRFAASCDDELLAVVIMDSRTCVTAGGAAVVEL